MFLKNHHASPISDRILLLWVGVAVVALSLLVGSCDQVPDRGFTVPTGEDVVSTDVTQDGGAGSSCRFTHGASDGLLINVPDSLWSRTWSQQIRFGPALYPYTWVWAIGFEGFCPPGTSVTFAQDENPPENVWLWSWEYDIEVPPRYTEIHWRHIPGWGFEWTDAGSSGPSTTNQSVEFGLELASGDGFMRQVHDTITVTISLESGCDCYIYDTPPIVGIVCPSGSTWGCFVRWSDPDPG